MDNPETQTTLGRRNETGKKRHKKKTNKSKINNKDKNKKQQYS
jgi:hypothetical protein